MIHIPVKNITKIFERIQLKYFIVLFSITGVLILYFLSLGIHPVQISLEEVPLNEGRQVIVQGFVNRYSTTRYGNQYITIQDLNHSKSSDQVVVFTEHPLPLRAGDTIQAMGTVQLYNNQWQITASSERDVIILNKWNKSNTYLWELAEYPTAFNGFNINITGMIDRIYDSYFFLIDETETHTLLVTYSPSLFRFIKEGQMIEVTGTFRYDRAYYRYQVTADNIYLLDAVEDTSW